MMTTGLYYGNMKENMEHIDSKEAESQQAPKAEHPEEGKRPYFRKRFSARFQYFLFLILFGGLVGASFAITIGLSRDLPQIANLENFKPKLSSRLYSSDGRVIADFGIEKRQRTSLARIPPHLVNAIIAVEDQNFYSHFGVDPSGILRAAIVDVRLGRMAQGGSTITQQLARNLFLTARRDISRKIRETILALQIERSYTKEQILELYLNQIFLGKSAYGVEEASQFYFGMHVQDLSLAQCALLAALPKAPNTYSPRRNPIAALRRRNLVLQMMYTEGYITEKECIEAKLEPIILAESTSQQTTLAPYFSEYVRQQIIDRYGYDVVYKGGLKVYTTLDLDMQKAAEIAIAEGLVVLDEKHMESGSRNATDESLPEDMLAARETGIVPADVATDVAQAALVAIDPNTGEIRAMVGGRDFAKSEFNRAVQARRQPGSGFKPIIWAAALEKGMTPSDRIVDAPVVFHFRDKVWKPENYEERFYGLTTLREALEHSRNIVSIRLLNQLGITPAIKLAHKMGIESYLQPNLTLALGSTGVTPLEITSAYGTIAGGGIHREPISILRIEGPNGETIEEKQSREYIAFSETTAYLLTSMMEGVVQRGTGRRANILKRPAAGKTGTTNDCTDAWFVGFTPQLVTGVWVGFDDMRSLGEKQTGGRVAAPIWGEFMKAALAEKPRKNFNVPPHVEFADVHPRSGLLAPPGSKDRLKVPFLEGTAPTKYFDPTEEERLTEDIMHIYSSDVSL
jgi:penicillin-binding protein 1A